MKDEKRSRKLAEDVFEELRDRENGSRNIIIPVSDEFMTYGSLLHMEVPEEMTANVRRLIGHITKTVYKAGIDHGRARMQENVRELLGITL